MIKKSLETALSAQINKEFFSAYLYLAMSAYFESINLPGHAHWTRLQAHEETAHAMEFFEHVIQRGGNVTLSQIEAPPYQWETPVAVFEHIYQHEIEVTESIGELVDLAIKEKDHATMSFLQKLVDEQVEEEASVNEVLQKLKRVGNDGPGLFMIDQELAKRTLVPTAQ